MSITTAVPRKNVSHEEMLGNERRWRRFGEPVPAGRSVTTDGEPDNGLFGPGSMVWEVLLHPATIVFETAAQGVMQTKAYKPIIAGVRDCDPMSRKGRAGTATFLDVHDRIARNSGMHAPLWLGDTKTATLMWKHLHNIHKRVTGDVIDAGNPGIGGYAASEPRDAMWAALTEMHPILRAYEAFAFRDGLRPHRLSDEQRDRFIEEAGAYLSLVGAPDDEIPRSMAELAALYEKYADVFAPSKTVDMTPDTGELYLKVLLLTCLRNFHISHLRMVPSLALAFAFNAPMMGAMSGKARRSMGVGKLKGAALVAVSKLFLPTAWVMQQPPVERYVQRLMWGPDGVVLIDSARQLHAEAKAREARS
jgi:uncharacterized protein (DUF2236 family)